MTPPLAPVGRTIDWLRAEQRSLQTELVDLATTRATMPNQGAEAHTVADALVAQVSLRLARVEEAIAELDRFRARVCDHVFRDSVRCVRCGWTPT